MNENPGQISSARVRGIIWVCDIKDSSKILNSDEKVDSFEQYIQRFYYFTCKIANAIGATMYKWTGDGFVAWFDCPLDRNAGTIATNILQACWHLSLLNNVTQFGVPLKSKVTIRHGITYEKDGLNITVKDGERVISNDYIGRDVVLAFRIAGIESDFPSIVTTSEVIGKADASKIRTKFMKPSYSNTDVLKYFKGERRGLQLLRVSTSRADKALRSKPKGTKSTLKGAIRNAERVIAEVESAKLPTTDFSQKYLKCFENGPVWVDEIGKEIFEFIRNDLFAKLKKLTADAKNKQKQISDQELMPNSQ